MIQVPGNYDDFLLLSSSGVPASIYNPSLLTGASTAVPIEDNPWCGGHGYTVNGSIVVVGGWWVRGRPVSCAPGARAGWMQWSRDGAAPELST